MSEPAGPADPFDTAGIRRRVLDAWTASPERFREDANAEEELALGAYRDRLLVELAQNAADAALRGGVPGVLRLTLVGDELQAANTGAPLDAPGVRALASLRASSKRDGAGTTQGDRGVGLPETVGRFGVGFAAVLAVTEEPTVLSRTGGVRFSASATGAEVEARPELASERSRRGGAVPVLRLPWPAEGEVPAGFDTVVRLPLRPEARAVVRAALDALSADLLLGLGGLVRIEVDDRVLEIESEKDTEGAVGGGRVVLLRDGADARRWRTVSTAGTVPGELLADRPTEERERDRWSVTWAVPVDGRGEPVPLPSGQVVHAPTPSAEPLSLPVRLIATFPLDSGRDHVATGGLTDHLVAQAGRAYTDLVSALPPTPAVLPLVPRVGLAAGALDAELGRATLAALRTTPWLPAPDQPVGTAADRSAVDGVAGTPVADQVGDQVDRGLGTPGGRIAPAVAAVVDGAGPDLFDVLRDVVAGLLPSEWSGRGAVAALTALGVRRLSTRDVVDLVSSVDRPPSWWRRLYAGLAEAPDRDALGALPVPLADGRVVTGPRGLVRSEVALPQAAALGLRVIHPDAAHPLLERLGAVPATPRALLGDDRVRAAVEDSLDTEEPEPVADAVLELAAAAGLQPGELPWLADLALRGSDGRTYPAGELLLPDAPLAGVIDPDGPFGTVDGELLRRWGAATLEAVGVLRTFAVLRTTDVEVGFGEHDLDGEQGWYDDLLDRLPDLAAPPRLTDLVAVRDLELVDPERWPEALALLASPPLRAAVTAPAQVVLSDDTVRSVPAYTRWWLARHPVLGGRRPQELRLPDATDLAGLYDVAPDTGIGAELLRFAGCLTGLAEVLADSDLAVDLLYRLGDPDRQAAATVLRDVYVRLAGAFDDYDFDPPERVRVAPDRCVPRARALVLDAPYLVPLLAGWAVVPAAGAPDAVADLLGVDRASEVVGDGVEVTTEPVEVRAWADVPGAELAAARCGAAVPDARVAFHTDLRVSGTDLDGPAAAGDCVGGPADGRGAAAVPPGTVTWWPVGDTDHVWATLDGAGADRSTQVGAAALGRALSWRLGRWDRRAAATEVFATALAGDLERTVTLTAEDTLEPLT